MSAVPSNARRAFLKKLYPGRVRHQARSQREPHEPVANKVAGLADDVVNLAPGSIAHGAKQELIDGAERPRRLVRAEYLVDSMAITAMASSTGSQARTQKIAVR